MNQVTLNQGFPVETVGTIQKSFSGLGWAARSLGTTQENTHERLSSGAFRTGDYHCRMRPDTRQIVGVNFQSVESLSKRLPAKARRLEQTISSTTWSRS